MKWKVVMMPSRQIHRISLFSLFLPLLIIPGRKMEKISSPRVLALSISFSIFIQFPFHSSQWWREKRRKETTICFASCFNQLIDGTTKDARVNIFYSLGYEIQTTLFSSRVVASSTQREVKFSTISVSCLSFRNDNSIPVHDTIPSGFSTHTKMDTRSILSSSLSPQC